MRRVLVLQHVAHELLGTLNPILKLHGLRMRYVNFQRTPDLKPTLDGYNGLIILGGPMGVYESKKYEHIHWELKLIEEALKRNIPVLGICLGSQMLAHVLGAKVVKGHNKELGWHDVHLMAHAKDDPLFGHFRKTEKIFQLHGDTFDIPKECVHLAKSEIFEGQAFRFGEKAYGLQFHLEVDSHMIERWLRVPAIKEDIAGTNGHVTHEQILKETESHIDNSLKLSSKTFSQFIKLFNIRERPILVGSGHGKTKK